MALDLNEPQKYRDFRTDETPRYINQMPLLISGKNLEGEMVDIPRIPFQVADVFERRINASKPDWMNASKPDWMNYWFDTVDGIVLSAQGAYTDGRFKIRKNSQSLKAVTPQIADTLIRGGIRHTSYEETSGTEFMSKDVIVNRDLNRDEAIDSPVLLELLNGDSSLRDAVVDKIFYEGKNRFNYDTMMGLFLPSELEEAHERALFVDWLDCGSWLVGVSDLLGDDARLVGKAPEAPVV